MDLLRIDNRTVNLDRLSAIVETVEAGPSGHDSRRVQLVLGDTTILLDEEKSEHFLAFLHRNYRVRSLGSEGQVRGVGGTIEGGADPDSGTLGSEPGA
ncbi:hypothetical protein [Singulisphaera sp. PoT]|uniref:hypothetical protein n=1 Tax=Singulisphaera sp. PoT TaxID=3411797 RepID=UPI003BF5C769